MSSEAQTHFSSALPNASGGEVPATEPLSTSRSNSKSSASFTAVNSSAKEQSNEDLLFEVSKGSKEALSVLFQRHARPLFNLVRHILKDDFEAENLVQELFLFLFQNAQLFGSEKSSVTSWIIQMTHHRAIDRRRYFGGRHHRYSQEQHEDLLPSLNGQLPVNAIVGRTLLNRLQQDLSAEQWHTLELHFFEGYSLYEIADKTGQTFGNVRNHYYRGLERLRCLVPQKKSASNERISTL
jgi:RNA polymerase sigma-70 factor, ECF subfamily